MGKGEGGEGFDSKLDILVHNPFLHPPRTEDTHHPGRRFVEQDGRHAPHQRYRQRQLPLAAPGVLHGGPPTHLLRQRHPGKDLPHSRLQPLPRNTLEAGVHPQLLPGRHHFQEGIDLGTVPQLRFHATAAGWVLGGGDAAAVHQDVTGRGGDLSGENAQARCLAGPVLAKDAAPFTVPDRQAQVMKGNLHSNTACWSVPPLFLSTLHSRITFDLSPTVVVPVMMVEQCNLSRPHHL